MKTSQKGLTLLELLISITLMAVLSITTTQMLRKSTTQTKKITSGIDEINQLRSSLNIIKKDVAKAINYRDLNLFLYNEAHKEWVKRYDTRVENYIKDLNKKEKLNPPVSLQTMTAEQKEAMIKKIGERPKKETPKKEVIFTHFIGDKEKVYFTSTSGVRFRAADKISDLVEVGYFLRTCKSRRLKNYESKCLWRSITYNIDEDITQGGKESVLLENVESAEFKYLSFNSDDIAKESVDWVNTWDSRSEGDIRTGGKFPAALSLALEIKIPDPKNKEKFKIERLTGIFPVDFANNDPFKKLKNSTANPAPKPGVGNL